MSPTRYVNLANLQQFTAVNLTADPGYDASDQTIPGVADIIIYWSTAAGKTAINRLHGQYQGAYSGSQAKANGILTALTTGANWTAYAATLATTTALIAIGIRDRGANNQPIVASSAAGQPGTGTGTELPDENSIVVTKRTAFTGPGHRGRIYLVGFTSAAIGAGNTITAPTVTAVNNWASIIAGALSTQGFTFGIGHTKRLAYVGASGKPHAARPAGFIPITSVSVRDNHWDTQRRRGLN